MLGLSGGIDSALTAAIAVEAVGADHVLGVLMPSPYSSRGSIDDSRQLAANLGIETLTLPIEPAMQAMEQTLARRVRRTRARRHGGKHPGAHPRQPADGACPTSADALLLTTGNKSELAVGYCTLYGDMSGGLAVIADVPKTMVYRVARWLNETAGRELIPEPILTKAPSAELRPNQTDQDSLPPYDVLDDILQRHIEQHQPADEIIAAGFDAETVRTRPALVSDAGVQAQTGGAGTEGHRPRVRHRLADADCRAADRHLVSVA